MPGHGTASFGNRVSGPNRRAGGARLRSARRAVGLSSDGLSQLLPADARVSPQAIRAYETGKNAPGVPMAQALEDVIIAEQSSMRTPPIVPLRRGDLLALFGYEVVAPLDQVAGDRVADLEHENSLLRRRVEELEALLGERDLEV